MGRPALQSSKCTVPAWRYIAAGGAISSILVVFGGGGAVAYADDRAPNSVDSGSRDSPSITDRSEHTSLREPGTESLLRSDTEPETTDPDDTDVAGESPRIEDAALPSQEEDTSTDSTVDSPPEVPEDVTPEDVPSIDPPAEATESGTATNSSTTAPDSSSGSVPVATASTDASSTSTPAVEPASVVSAPPVLQNAPVVENAPATGDAPISPAAEPTTAVSVPISAAVTTVSLVSVTAVVAPPSILQWFVLLTWAQLQWLIQQQLSGSAVTPILNRLGIADPRLISAVYPSPSSTASLPTQFSWFTTTLDALQGMRSLGLPIDPALLQRTSATLAAAEAAKLPAIVKALTDQVTARSGLQPGLPCVGTFIRNVSIWALFTAAALGLFGMVSLTGLGTMVGFRQAKAGYALRAAGLARFSGPGPLGIVRETGFVQIGSRRSSAEPARLRAVASHLRDSA
ncbi:hypothetical protein [Mycobacterium kyogaense]|uniref:hypothetical protein n=1 Tax=Mycobacterium kyogaense TaxID=2212479 RepID=UPI0013C41F72|nr:hypothetical protein [Mycobacterium kyogaense]